MQHHADVIYILFYLQRHDIFKKRLDSHGNVIEARQDGIGAPKVGIVTILYIILRKMTPVHPTNTHIHMSNTPLYVGLLR